MRRFHILFLLTLLSCFSEENADLGGNFTFIRYFNGGGNDQAVAIRETADKGYIILANTTTDGITKIKLIKTDELGNKSWSKIYEPSAVADSVKSNRSYIGFGLDVLPEGNYAVAGQFQYTNKNDLVKSELVVLIVEEEDKVDKTIHGALLQRVEIADPEGRGVQGKAIRAKLDASKIITGYLVLANVLNSTNANPEDMVLSELKTDLSPLWVQTYGAGVADVTNKLFIDEAGKVLWGGTVQHSGGTDMRFVKTDPNRKNTDFDLPIGSPGFDERGNDICNFGFGYAIIGNTNETASGDRDILFKLLADDGSEKISKTFPIMIGEDPVPGNKTGNAITSTQDWGFLLACTVPSNSELKFGRGEADIYLIKIDGYGTVIWEKSIGSTKDEQSVAVLQASDGGYIILGTSDFAGLSTVMLMKTDKNGDIQ